MYDFFEEENYGMPKVPEPSEPTRRTRAQRRKQSVFKAIRKRRINAATTDANVLEYDNLHQYSKNKIYCSCPRCRNKTTDGGVYGKKHNPSAADVRRMDKMNASYQEDFRQEEIA